MYNQHPTALARLRDDFAAKMGANFKVQDSLLCLCAIPKKGVSSLKFKVQQAANDKELYAEQRLVAADIFSAIAIQMTIRQYRMIEGKAYPIGEEYTCVPETIFKGKKNGISTVQSLRTLYDCELLFGTRNKARLQPIKTKRFYYTDLDKKNDATRGYIYLNDPLFLEGNKTDTFVIELPDVFQDAIEGKWDENEKETDMFNVVTLNLYGFNCPDKL